MVSLGLLGSPKNEADILIPGSCDCRRNGIPHMLAHILGPLILFRALRYQMTLVLRPPP